MDQLNKYARGKIYAIICIFTGEVYLGSTTMESIKDRISQHTQGRRSYLRWVSNGKPGAISSNITSYPLIARGMWTYFCVEEYPCTSKKELHAREGHHIRLFKERYGALCVNRKIPGRSHAERRKENREAYRKIDAKSYTKHGPKYLARAREKIECQFCGHMVNRGNKSRHERTEKCKTARSALTTSFTA